MSSSVYFRLDWPVTMMFTLTMEGFIADVVNATISAESHFLSVSLSPTLVEGEYMRLVLNWVNGLMNLDLYATQIDK